MQLLKSSHGCVVGMDIGDISLQPSGKQGEARGVSEPICVSLVPAKQHLPGDHQAGDVLICSQIS